MNDNIKITKKKLLDLLFYLELPRAIENRMLNYLRQGKISKWFSGIGQEAISVGSTYALNNDDITIYGDGSQTRSFSYVDDTVNGILALMKSDKYDVFNIGNPNEMSITELSSVILRLTDSKSKLVYEDLPNDDPKQRRPDITKAKEHLNWEPKVDLEEGLTMTIDWIKKELAK